MSGVPPLALEQIRQLADGRGLAGAVDADDQRHLRAAMPTGSGVIDRGEDGADLLLDQIAEARAVPRLPP